MYYLQGGQGERYAVLSDGNRISMRLLAPSRGLILDRHGRPMAVNRQNSRVSIISERVRGLDATLSMLSNIISIGDHDRARILREIRRNGRRRFIPVTVRENLSWEDVARIELNIPDLSGVMTDVGQSRDYPLANLGAHLLGYVAAVDEKDKEGQTDPLLDLPGFRIGKAGVEKVYDMALRGKGGSARVEVNNVGRTIRELESDEGESGGNLFLTIDLDLQQYASERLGEESGAAVVMDVGNGEVLAMASTPSFDPNDFSRGLSAAKWKELNSDPRAPLRNKATSGQFPPGSTFKVVTALAALESGLVKADTRVSCSGHVDLGGVLFHCWKRSGHGSVDMHQGLKYSCDVYFYEIARRIGYERIAEMAKRFGLGEATGIDLPSESPGLIPNRAWKRAVLKQPWVPGDNLNNAIGQGYVQATPLQLAVMTARIASGGLKVAPHLARDWIEGDEISPRAAPVWPSLGVSAASLAVVRGGMSGVVNEPDGTAYRSRIVDQAMAMAGKTGSAQVRRISMREREGGVKRNESLPWALRDHALFIGYAPLVDPRFACSVVVEHGGGGSVVAAPICRDILIETQKRAARVGPVPERS
ncbi:peptidoglycan glycosyltransferase [Alphaproteobacteria bacterium]|nr:peptidoglycan glycosyltransferase [Alphaproteobacteria bacterium]